MPGPVDGAASSYGHRGGRRSAAFAQHGRYGRLPSTPAAVDTAAAAATTAATADRSVFSTASTVVGGRVDRTDAFATGDTEPDAGVAGGAAVGRRRCVAGGHRQADRTKVQHVQDHTTAPPSVIPTKDVADVAAAAADATGSRPGRQTRVGNTETEHRGARPEQSAADSRGAVHAGHGVLDGHPEGTVHHALEKDRLLHGRAHGHHTVSQKDRLLHGQAVL